MEKLLEFDESFRQRLSRRVRSIGAEVVLFVLITALFPVLAFGAALVDLALYARSRKVPMALRLLSLLWWFLFDELRCLAGLFGLWVRSARRDRARPRYRARVYELRIRYLVRHFSGVRWLFRLRFDVQGLDDLLPGPILVLIRHSSMVDNLIGDGIICRPLGLKLRYVLKRELIMLPTIDIGRRWCPTVFVRRGSGRTEVELERMRRLPMSLDDDEGLVIYPEGTLYTAPKLACAQEIIAERQPEVAPLANRLRHVLPPRLGGAIALLKAAPGVDPVICGHVGLDGFESMSEIWRGGLVGSTVRIRFWRHSAADVPLDDDEGMISWLYDRWFELDDWIDAHVTSGGVRLAAKATA
jgi:1-acyl-sn-glycerol-3-phosphate acyltransferase